MEHGKVSRLFLAKAHADNHRQQQVTKDVVAECPLELSGDEGPEAALAARSLEMRRELVKPRNLQLVHVLFSAWVADDYIATRPCCCRSQSGHLSKCTKKSRTGNGLPQQGVRRAGGLDHLLTVVQFSNCTAYAGMTPSLDDVPPDSEDPRAGCFSLFCSWRSLPEFVPRPFDFPRRAIPRQSSWTASGVFSRATIRRGHSAGLVQHSMIQPGRCCGATRRGAIKAIGATPALRGIDSKSFPATSARGLGGFAFRGSTAATR